MLRFIAGRLIVVIAVAITLSFITFFLLNYAIDAAQAVAGEEALFEEIEQVRIQYGFDRPILERYFEWASGVMKGNFGESYYWNKSVYLLVLERAPETITLALMSVSVTIIIAIPLGILAALNPNTIIDRFALGIAVAAQAVPNFWLGLLMIILFALTFPIFPVSGDKTYFHFVLPSIVLGASSVPPVMRLMRTGLLDVVDSVITESVFAINGLGRLALESILGTDIPTVQILVFIFAFMFLIFNLFADILNAYLDPRLRK